MTRPQTIGNRIMPWRFLVFFGTFILVSFVLGGHFHSRALGIMAGFDAAAIVFMALCLFLLSIRDPLVIEQLAKQNDGNRTLQLVLTGVVIAVLMVAVASETVGRNPQPVTKILIISTLGVAWVFSNTIYALHYAHLAYITPGSSCDGLDFPSTPLPVYWDFVYFAFTLGMTFQTSDVTITNERIRRVVTVHCLAAFFFNIGVLAFTINVLGSG